MKPIVIAWLMVVVTLGVIGWQGVEAYQLISMSPISELPPKQVERRVTSKQHFDVQRLARANVFGVVAKNKPVAVVEKKQPKVDVESLPETKLKLTLKGAFKGGEDAASYALISQGRGKEKVYYIDDRVSGGAVLYAVNADNVVLKKGSRLEALSFKRDLGEGNSVKRIERNRSRRSANSNNRRALYDSDEESVPSLEELGDMVPQEMLDRLGELSEEQMRQAGGTPGDMPYMDSIKQRLDKLRQMKESRRQ